MVASVIQVRHNDSDFDIDYDVGNGLEGLKNKLFSLTSIPPDDQKIMGVDDNRIISDDSDLAATSGKLLLVSTRNEQQQPSAGNDELLESDAELARRLQEEEEEELFLKQHTILAYNGELEETVRAQLTHLTHLTQAPVKVPVKEINEKALAHLAKVGNLKPSTKQLHQAHLLQVLLWLKLRCVNQTLCDGSGNNTISHGMGVAPPEILQGGSQVEICRSGMVKGITEVLEKALEVDGLGLEHENKLQKFQEQDRQTYIHCLAKVLFGDHFSNGIRELAGLLLRNEVKNADNLVEELFGVHLNWIKYNLLTIICDPIDCVPRSTCQVISELARNMLECWPQLTALIEKSLHDEQPLTPAALEAFGYIAEKIRPEGLLGRDTVGKIYKVLVRGMNLKSKDSVCLASTKAMCYALSFAETTSLEDMEAILTSILEAVRSSNPNIKQAAFECLIVLPSRFYCNFGLSPTHLMNIIEVAATAVREGTKDDAFQVIQFCCSICEAEIDILKKINSGRSYQCYYLIRGSLNILIPLLLPLLHIEEIELLDEKAIEFDRSLRLCVGYIAQAVGEHVASFAEAVKLFIANGTAGYKYLAKIIAITVDVFMSDIFGEEEVSEENKRLDLTEGGKEGKAANEMERREGSQKPHKEKGLGQWKELLLRQMLRIVGGLLEQDCEFLHDIFTETVTRYSPHHPFLDPSAKMRDACGHYINSDAFSYLRETHGDDLLRKFLDSWRSLLCMIQVIWLFFSVCGCHSGEVIENLQKNQLQISGLSWILLLIFPKITDAMTELIDVATKEGKQIDRYLLKSVTEIYVDHGFRESSTNEASALCAESIVMFCENLLKRGGSNDEITKQLEIVGGVSKYFIDIGHFSQFYCKRFGSRIHCVDWEQERRMLAMVRDILFDGEQASSFGDTVSLVNDIALDAQKFEEFLVNNPGAGMVMNLATVGPHWPFKDVSFENLILPEKLVKMAEVAKEFVETTPRQRGSRKFVKMIHPLSSCTIECMFGTERIELDMSIAQFALLKLFDTADTWTFSELLTQLRITNDELVSLINSLSQENSKLLVKEPNTVNMLPTDRFELNTNFTFTSPIPLPVLEDKSRKNVVERVGNDMSLTIRCMLMKVMKQCKDSGPMDSEKLAGATIGLCAGLKNCGFLPTKEAVDNCIAFLIKNEYLLVDENDPNKLRWNYE